MTEDFDTLDAGMGNIGLALSSIDRNNLRTAGKWGRFIAITSIVLIGLAVVGMVIFSSSMLMLVSGLSMFTGGGGLLSLMFAFYVILFAGSIYLYWQLLQFSNNAIKAADTVSPVAMTAAFSSLKKMLKLSGILLAIVIGLYTLMFLYTAISGIVSGF